MKRICQRSNEVPISEEEQWMIEEGVQRYRHAQEKLSDAGHYEALESTNVALNKSLEPYREQIQYWIKRAMDGEAAASAAYAVCLNDAIELCGINIITYVSAREIMRGAQERAGVPRIALEASRAIEFQVRAKYFNRYDPKLFSSILPVLSQSTPMFRKGKLLSLGRKRGIVFPSWTTKSKVAIGLVLVHLFQQATKFTKMEVSVQDRRKRAMTYLSCTPSFLEWQKDFNNRRELLTPVFMPCVAHPKDWVLGEPFSGGYYNLRIPIVHFESSVQLYPLEVLTQELTYGEAISCLNKVQSQTLWTINKRVLDVIKTLWDSQKHGEALSEIIPIPPDQIPLPTEKYPNETETMLRKRKAVVWLKRRENARKRLLVARSIEVVADNRYLKERPFYTPMRMDYRGRMYTISTPMLSFQGSDLTRGLMQFHQGTKLIDVHSLEIHGANCAGLDKKTITERAVWVHTHKQRIFDTADRPLDDLWWAQMDEPVQFLAFCFDYTGCVRDGLETRQPCVADATSSGFQILALLSNDIRLAELTNVIPSDTRKDFYDHIATMLREEVTLQLPINPRFRWPLRMGIDRKFVKEAIMSIPYGSSINGIADMFENHLCDWHFRTNFDNTDNRASELTSISGQMAVILINILKREHPKIFVVMDALKDMVRVLHKRDCGVKWTTPSGFPFRLQMPRRKVVRVAPILVRGTKASTSVFDEEEGTLNQSKNIKAICANFIHSIDAAILHKTIARFEDTTAPLITIHDCVGSNANHVEELKRLYKAVVVEVFSQDFNLVMDILNANLTPEEVTKVLNGNRIENISKELVANIPQSVYFMS